MPVDDSWKLPDVAPRARLLAFGSAALMVVAGALCAVLVVGTLGQVLTFVLMSLGIGGAVLLVFLEVGLSEDRERAREAERERLARERAAPRHPERAPQRHPRWRRRPG